MNKMQIKTILIFFLLINVCFNFAFAQDEDLDILNNWIRWSSPGSMLINQVNKKAFHYLDLRDKEISKLKTKSDWIERRKKVKDILMKTVGPFPEKTPLNPQITGVLQKKGYRVEKIIIETMPEYYLTGCLFIPDGINGRRPAILDNIGHSEGSFRKESYQNVIHNLVKKGFIVFAIDPVGQAEKDHYFDPVTKKTIIEEGVPAHMYFGNQCYISGFSSAKYFIWDGIRAIDYLLTRDEVDGERIGVTGLSGGGTVTSYMCAFDERIAAAAPYNWAIYDRRLIETIGVQMAEGNIYHGLLNGITYADFLEAGVPKPTLMIKTTRDFLGIQGAREAYQEIMRAYKAFGKEENLQMAEDDDLHCFTKKNNEATYAFFQKHLNLPGDPAEEEVEMLTREELTVTPTGQISTYLGGETVFSLNKKETEGLIINLEESRKNITEHLNNVKTKAIGLSGYSFSDCNYEPFFCGRYNRDGYSVEKYALSGTEDYIIPMLLFIPNGDEKFSTVVYLHPDGKTAQASAGGQIETLVKKGFIVAAPDLLGMGETKNTCGRRRYKPIVDYTGVLSGISVVGIQAGNIASVVNYLKTRDDVENENIGAVAIGEMCPTLIHAAAFNQSISSIALLGSPISYRTIVMNEFYKVKFFCAVAGALTAYDLPDLIGCIAPRKVVLADLKDQMLEPATAELIKQELEFPRSVYSYKGVSDNLKIMPSSESLEEIIDWCF